MPGAWEIRQQNSVLVAILHTEVTTMAWSFGLRNLIVPGQILPLTGMPFDMARNESCKACLAGPFEWLFSLDSDVIPPHDAIPRLISRNLPIVSGLYCRRSPPNSVAVAIRNGQWVTEYEQDSLVEVDLVGAGCLLIHRSVLERLPPQRPEAGKHWFDWRVDCKDIMPHDACLSEDFTLCRHARKHGYKVILDTSVKCKHVGLAESGFGTFGPLILQTQT